MDSALPSGMAPTPTPVPAFQRGLIRVLNNDQMLAMEEQARQSMEAAQNKPVILGLAAYVRKCWDAAYTAKQNIERELLDSLNRRNGVYDETKKQEITKFGGSDVFMRITGTKCRAAESWLRDIFLNIERPYAIDPTPLPDLPTNKESELVQQVEMLAQQTAMTTGQPVSYEERTMLLGQLKEQYLQMAREEAKKGTERMSRKIEDILVEGGFYEALDKLVTDITTFKTVCIKGPVIRSKTRLKWEQSPDGEWNPVTKDEFMYCFERVSPFDIFPAPRSGRIGEGYIIQRHRMSRTDLNELLGAPGYDDEAIRKVLDLYGQGGLNQWLSIDAARADAERKDSYDFDPQQPIDALEFWGSVQGKMLLDWGIEDNSIDKDREYSCSAWLIGPYVIKAVINQDPLGRWPYAITSWEKSPDAFWGMAPPDLLKDVQDVANAAGRSLVNNMGISSGPQVVVNIDRLPPGEDISQLAPWNIHQVVTDPMGSSAPAIDFFQPNSNADVLLGVYEKFSQLADEYTSIPRYMMGDGSAGQAGRTASGLSMLMNAANKGIKQVVNNIDNDIIVPVLNLLHYHLMKYHEDNTIKGDVQIKARGANGLVLKEAIQLRRNEFMQLALTNPVVNQVVGINGVAELLREVVKGLDFNPDKIVPSPEMLQQQQMAMQQQMMAEQGTKNMPQGGNQETLMNGQPTTDNFSPNSMRAGGNGRMPA